MTISFNNHKYTAVPYTAVQNDVIVKQILKGFQKGNKIKFNSAIGTLHCYKLNPATILIYEKTNEGEIQNRIAIIF